MFFPWPAVLFVPEDPAIAKDPDLERRRYLDWKLLFDMPG